ncbi:hypothetical protein PTKIN_Ptkin09bG0119800 [Pterospermum kingtungense]
MPVRPLSVGLLPKPLSAAALPFPSTLKLPAPSPQLLALSTLAPVISTLSSASTGSSTTNSALQSHPHSQTRFVSHLTLHSHSRIPATAPLMPSSSLAVILSLNYTIPQLRNPRMKCMVASDTE